MRSNDGKLAIIDYAHTPDALKNVLAAITEIRTRNEQVITVVGAGGDRDKTKRPEMAKEALLASDKVILLRIIHALKILHRLLKIWKPEWKHNSEIR
jgi:UDP-N-acetylmuramoyl-L-alanyl-D-glutamate--2,6-diaminopimelate ligase